MRQQAQPAGAQRQPGALRKVALSKLLVPASGLGLSSAEVASERALQVPCMPPCAGWMVAKMGPFFFWSQARVFS